MSQRAIPFLKLPNKQQSPKAKVSSTSTKNYANVYTPPPVQISPNVLAIYNKYKLQYDLAVKTANAPLNKAMSVTPIRTNLSQNPIKPHTRSKSCGVVEDLVGAGDQGSGYGIIEPQKETLVSIEPEKETLVSIEPIKETHVSIEPSKETHVSESTRSFEKKFHLTSKQFDVFFGIDEAIYKKPGEISESPYEGTSEMYTISSNSLSEQQISSTSFNIKSDKQTSVTTLLKNSSADKQTSATRLPDSPEILSSLKSLKEASSNTSARTLTGTEPAATDSKDEIVEGSEVQIPFTLVIKPKLETHVEKQQKSPKEQQAPPSRIKRYESRSHSNANTAKPRRQKPETELSYNTVPTGDGTIPPADDAKKYKTQAEKSFAAFEKREDERRSALAQLLEIQDNIKAKNDSSTLNRKTLQKLILAKNVDCLENEEPSDNARSPRQAQSQRTSSSELKSRSQVHAAAKRSSTDESQLEARTARNSSSNLETRTKVQFRTERSPSPELKSRIEIPATSETSSADWQTRSEGQTRIERPSSPDLNTENQFLQTRSKRNSSPELKSTSKKKLTPDFKRTELRAGAERSPSPEFTIGTRLLVRKEEDRVERSPSPDFKRGIMFRQAQTERSPSPEFKLGTQLLVRSPSPDFATSKQSPERIERSPSPDFKTGIMFRQPQIERSPSPEFKIGNQLLLGREEERTERSPSPDFKREINFREAGTERSSSPEFKTGTLLQPKIKRSPSGVFKSSSQLQERIEKGSTSSASGSKVKILTSIAPHCDEVKKKPKMRKNIRDLSEITKPKTKAVTIEEKIEEIKKAVAVPLDFKPKGIIKTPAKIVPGEPNEVADFMAAAMAQAMTTAVKEVLEESKITTQIAKLNETTGEQRMPEKGALYETAMNSLKYVKPKERSALIEGYQLEKTNLYVLPEEDENLTETISSTEQFTGNSTMIGPEIETVLKEPEFPPQKTDNPSENIKDENPLGSRQNWTADSAEAKQPDEGLVPNDPLKDIDSTMKDIEASYQEALYDLGQLMAEKQLKAHSHLTFNKARSFTTSSIESSSPCVESSPPPQSKEIKRKVRKRRKSSSLDRIDTLPEAPVKVLEPVKVNLAKLDSVYVKCPDSACKRNMKLLQFGWHMAVEHFSTLTMEYLELHEVGILNILVANVLWATRRPIKTFMLKHVVVDIGCRFYNKYLPFVAMLRPVHCDEIQKTPLFGEPLAEEYLMIWFTGIALKTCPLFITLTLRNGEFVFTKRVELYGVQRNQCLIDVYVSGCAILITHDMIKTLTLGENLLLRGEIVVERC